MEVHGWAAGGAAVTIKALRGVAESDGIVTAAGEVGRLRSVPINPLNAANGKERTRCFGSRENEGTSGA